MTGDAVIWQLSSVSTQFLGEYLEQHLLSCVQEEVGAGKHPQRKGSFRLLAPAVEIVATYPAILQATKAGDAASQRRLGRVRICFVDSEVCPQDRKHDLHEFCVLQQFFRGAIQAAQFFQEFQIG